MFGRNPRPNPPNQPPPQQPSGPYSRIPPGSSDRYDEPYDRPPANNQRPFYGGVPPEKHDYSRGQSRQGPGGQTWRLQPVKSPEDNFIYGNLVAISPFDFPPSQGNADLYLILNDLYVCTARTLDSFPRGLLGLSDFQRSWAGISLQDIVDVRKYDPFQEGGPRSLGLLDVEISFAGKKETEEPYDQDELQYFFTKVWELRMMLKYIANIYIELREPSSCATRKNPHGLQES